MILLAILICTVMSAVWYAVGFYQAKKRFEQDSGTICCDPHNVVTLIAKEKVPVFAPMFSRFDREQFGTIQKELLKNKLLDQIENYIVFKRTDDVLGNVEFAAYIKVIDYSKGE